MKRDVNRDNLKPFEWSVIQFMSATSRPVTVQEIAEALIGEDAPQEAKGEKSLRTVRNALRMPKDMGIVETNGKRGVYTLSEGFKSYGRDFVVQQAARIKFERELRREQNDAS